MYMYNYISDHNNIIGIDNPMHSLAFPDMESAVVQTRS